MTPLISIIVPCFDAANTLGTALASVRAQTVGDWECIVVDDGCRQPVAPLVDAVGDDRFRVVRFETNRGRGAARQQGLEMARGLYVCMLDADDWYYRDKLERQLRLLEGRPEWAAAAMSMAVFDDRQRLVGIRAVGNVPPTVHRGRRHRAPNIPFSTLMIRRRIAQRHRFEAGQRRAEDRDYLMRTLAERRFVASAEIGYAYREIWSPQAMEEALSAFRCRRRNFRHYIRHAPFSMALNYGLSWMRTGLYSAARILGGGPWLFERRNSPPTPLQRRRFRQQRKALRRTTDRLISNTTRAS